jgi:hypothetical protein
MKLLIMQFSATSCLFIPLWSKYSPQHPVLKQPQSMRPLPSSNKSTWKQSKQTGQDMQSLNATNLKNTSLKDAVG